MLFETERTGLFVDGPSLHLATKTLDLSLDYDALRRYFAARCELHRATYFMPESADTAHHHRLRDFLQFNGWTVIRCPRRSYCDPEDRSAKGSTDISLTVHAMKLARAPLDHVVLVTGKAALVPLVEGLQEQLCRVTIVSTRQSDVPMVADDLRRQADAFLDLADLREHITRADQAA